MDIRNQRAVHNSAAESLANAAGQPKQTVLVYAGIICLMALLSAVISLILDNQIAETGGLSSMGLRSALSTVQSVLPILQLVVTTCLGLGYHVAVLNISRGRASAPQTLLEGFRRFGPLLRASLLQFAIYFAIAMVAMYLSIYIFLLLPVSDSFYEIMAPILNSTSILETGIAMDDATLVSATSALAPMMVIFLALFCLIFIPIYYQYRMVMFCVADEPRTGAMKALRDSRAMMRRNRFALFKLDLSFWWYYLLQALITVVCYGDVLLPMVGVTLPWSGTVSYFVFYVLALALQIVVYYFFMNRVNVTYATAYNALRPKPQEPAKVTLGNIFDLAKDYHE